MAFLTCAFRVVPRLWEQWRDIGGGIQHAYNLYELGEEKYIVVRC